MSEQNTVLRREIDLSERSLSDRAALLRGYLMALAEVTRSLGPSVPLERVATSKSFQRIRRKSVDPSSVWPHLRSAWKREAQLVGQVQESSRAHYAAAQWPEDLYGLAKAAATAFVAATGARTQSDHRFILGTVSSELERRGDLFAPPWNLRLAYDGGWHFQGAPGGLLTMDPGRIARPSPWERVFSLIRQAHSDRKERGQLGKQSNLFGALFWLRNRSAYTDDFRADTPTPELVLYGEACLDVASSVLANMELLVVSYLGMDVYATIVDGYTRTRSEPNDVRNLLNRRELVRSAIS